MNIKHKFHENLAFIVKNWIRWDFKGMVSVFIKIPVSITVPILTAMIPEKIINATETGTDIYAFIIGLSLISTLVLFLKWFKRALEAREEEFQAIISRNYAIELLEKLMKIEYKALERYEGRALLQRCRNFAFEGAQSDGAWAAVRLAGLISSLLGICTYSVLFGKVSIVLLFFILLSCVVEYAINLKIIKYGDHTASEMVNGEMKSYYFYRTATDPEIGKDIRLCGAAQWLMKHLDRAAEKYLDIMHWYTIKVMRLNWIQIICTIMTLLFSSGT